MPGAYQHPGAITVRIFFLVYTLHPSQGCSKAGRHAEISLVRHVISLAVPLSCFVYLKMEFSAQPPKLHEQSINLQGRSWHPKGQQEPPDSQQPTRLSMSESRGASAEAPRQAPGQGRGRMSTGSRSSFSSAGSRFVPFLILLPKQVDFLSVYLLAEDSPQKPDTIADVSSVP